MVCKLEGGVQTMNFLYLFGSHSVSEGEHCVSLPDVEVETTTGWHMENIFILSCARKRIIFGSYLIARLWTRVHGFHHRSENVYRTHHKHLCVNVPVDRSILQVQYIRFAISQTCCMKRIVKTADDSFSESTWSRCSYFTSPHMARWALKLLGFIQWALPSRISHENKAYIYCINKSADIFLAQIPCQHSHFQKPYSLPSHSPSRTCH